MKTQWNGQTQKKTANSNTPHHSLTPTPRLAKLHQASKYFGVDIHSRTIPALNLLFRDGGIVSFPYIRPPVLQYKPGNGITIKIDDDEIIITGRKLETLMKWLCTHKVIWIKESNTGRGLEVDDIFIENIIVKEKS